MKHALRVLKLEKFFQARPAPLDPPLVGQNATADPLQPLQYHSMHILCTQVLSCTLLSLGTNMLGCFGLTG